MNKAKISCEFDGEKAIFSCDGTIRDILGVFGIIVGNLHCRLRETYNVFVASQLIEASVKSGVKVAPEIGKELKKQK